MGAGEKIRVLIVDNIAETRENIRKLLQFESDVEVVGAARTGREGIDMAKETRPDVVLIDLNMPDMDGIMATELIRRNNAFTEIIILSVQTDSNSMRRAMLAGARDFLSKPPSIDELIAAIRTAGKLAQDKRLEAAPVIPVNGNRPMTAASNPSHFGKIVAVYSPKGGTGVTTVAVNLAMTLHNDETRVALVDGNLQFGDIAVFLNEQSKNSIVDLTPRVDELDPEVVEEVMIHHGPSGVKVLTSPSRPENAENVTGEQMVKVLQYLRRMFSYVVVDASSDLNDVTLGILDGADVIVLLTTQDIPSIKNARLFLDLADILKIDRRHILFVMNRYDKRIGITPEKVGESFKHEIVTVIPNEDRVVVPSINRGVPFMVGDRSKPISRSFLSLAEVLRQRMTEDTEAELERIPAFLNRIGRR